MRFQGMEHETSSTVERDQIGTWTPLHTVGLLVLTLLASAIPIWRPFSLFQDWLVVMALMCGFIVLAGHGIKGVWRGAFIDERNKISLSRLQILLWTILLLSAYGAIVVSRIPHDPLEALDIAIPSTLWFLMGISTTTMVGAPTIRQQKNRQTTVGTTAMMEHLEFQGVDPSSLRMNGHVVCNHSARDASWSDLFMGEEYSNTSYLELGKVQLFFFTVLLVVTYGMAVGSILLSGSVPSALPDISEGMLPLLGISHGGYLANKAVPTSPKMNGAPDA